MKILKINVNLHQDRFVFGNVLPFKLKSSLISLAALILKTFQIDKTCHIIVYLTSRFCTTLKLLFCEFQINIPKQYNIIPLNIGIIILVQQNPKTEILHIQASKVLTFFNQYFYTFSIPYTNWFFFFHFERLIFTRIIECRDQYLKRSFIHIYKEYNNLFI